MDTNTVETDGLEVVEWAFINNVGEVIQAGKRDRLLETWGKDQIQPLVTLAAAQAEIERYKFAEIEMEDSRNHWRREAEHLRAKLSTARQEGKAEGMEETLKNANNFVGTLHGFRTWLAEEVRRIPSNKQEEQT